MLHTKTQNSEANFCSVFAGRTFSTIHFRNKLKLCVYLFAMKLKFSSKYKCFDFICCF